MSSSAAHTLTIRMPEALYESAASVARERNQSVNALIQDALRKTISEIDEKRRFDEYTLLGQDNGCDVEYAIHAQAEVMLSE